MENVFEVKHPLIEDQLAHLRDQATPSPAFRYHIQWLTTLLTYEATKDLNTRTTEIDTPLARVTCRVLSQRIGLIPILRAGLGMVEPILSLMPHAEVWHLGFYRDENTLKPVKYYNKIPAANPVDVALVVDPMLATGGSARAALQVLKKWQVPRLKLLSIIAAPEGIQRVREEQPDAQIYVCAIDERLNEAAYIVPGLGDAGDRIFNARAD